MELNEKEALKISTAKGWSDEMQDLIEKRKLHETYDDLRTEAKGFLDGLALARAESKEEIEALRNEVQFLNGLIDSRDGQIEKLRKEAVPLVEFVKEHHKWDSVGLDKAMHSVECRACQVLEAYRQGASRE